MAVSFVADTQALQNVNASSVTFSFPAGTADAIAVFVMLEHTSQSVSSITFNVTENLASIGAFSETTTPNACRIEAWGKAPSVGGTHNVVVTLSASNTAWDASAISYLGADQTGGSSTFNGFQSTQGNNSVLNLSVTVTSASGNIVQDGTCSVIQANGTTASADWTDNSGSTNTQGKHYAGATSVVCTENWDNAVIGVMCGFNVSQATVTVTPPRMIVDNNRFPKFLLRASPKARGF
jgi:hypothetical protein